MYMTLKSSGNGSKASMVQVSSSYANGKGERPRRTSSRRSEAATFRGFTVRPSSGRRTDDSARRSQDSGIGRCNTQSTRSSLSPVQKQPSIGRHSSFSDGSSQNQMHLTPVLDQSDDILYDTDHYQDVLTLPETSAILRPFAPSSIDTSMSFDSLLQNVDSPGGPLSDLLQQPHTANSSGTGAGSGCSCTNDLLRIVQQFDDDDFGLKALSLDEVMKLQKWILFQCCQPLDCLTCQALPAIHTILLIICDRLAEVFECIHKRIKRANQSLLTPASSEHGSAVGFSTASTAATTGGAAENTGGSGHSPTSQAPGSRGGMVPDIGLSTTGLGGNLGLTPGNQQQQQEHPSFGNLFCASTGIPASKSDCNPNLFPPDFQRGYSDEEQVHMIRVLLKLQTRNFRGLLLRLDGNVSHFTHPNHTANEARKSKVKSLIERLSLAEVGIDNALRAKFQEIFSSMPHMDLMTD